VIGTIRNEVVTASYCLNSSTGTLERDPCLNFTLMFSWHCFFNTNLQTSAEVPSLFALGSKPNKLGSSIYNVLGMALLPICQNRLY
jgi:hypothetical protein